MRWILSFLAFISSVALADSPRNLFLQLQDQIQKANEADNKSPVQSFQGSAQENLDQSLKAQQKTEENQLKDQQEQQRKLMEELHPQAEGRSESEEEEDNTAPYKDVENNPTENTNAQAPLDKDLSKGSELNEDKSQ